MMTLEEATSAHARHVGNYRPKTDIVIPLGSGSKHKDIELRYALRGVEQHLEEVGKVFIIGTKPEWLDTTEAVHIPFEEKNWYQYLTRNIHYKIMTACMDERVSDTFLFMNDDHFLLKGFIAGGFPYHHTGSGDAVWKGRGKYLVTMSDTRGLLGWDIRNFDTHAPMLINKDKYIATVGKENWSKHYGWCIKTMYCVQNGITGEYYPDLKIDWAAESCDEIYRVVAGRPYFSVGDRAMTPVMKEYLNSLYPTPSKYEL